MSQPSLVIGTLCLNEMQWLPKLYEQHKDWPGLARWVFVEAVDAVYAAANPNMVAHSGSVDGTTEFLEELAKRDDRVVHVRHGVARHRDVSQGKCPARNRYLELADEVRPQFVLVLDADEIYARQYQEHACQRLISEVGWVVRQRHIWFPPSEQLCSNCDGAGHTNLRRDLHPGDHLWEEYKCPDCEEGLLKVSLRSEVVGGYWEIPHARLWRWRKGMRHTDDHNIPDGCGKPSLRYHATECVHMGFASRLAERQAKHAYYLSRGEGGSRRLSVECRAAWEAWKPGDQLPHRARVVPYTGVVPEVFR